MATITPAQGGVCGLILATQFRILICIHVFLQYKFLFARFLCYTTPKSNWIFLIWQDIGVLKIVHIANLNIPNPNIYISTLINRVSLMQ